MWRGSFRTASGRGSRLKRSPAVWYFRRSSGNNSVVECDLAKVEVAGSNPVSRSNFVLPSHVAQAREACPFPPSGPIGAVAKR